MLETNAPQLRFILNSELFGRRLLQHDPVGWDQMGLSLHRDPKYHGIATEYNEETLGFIKDGKKYIEQAYALLSIEADITLEIQVLDPNAFLWNTYRVYRLDLTAAEQLDTEFRCGLDQSGMLQKFLNREDAQVDLWGNSTLGNTAAMAATPVAIEMHSRAIYQRYESRIVDAAVVAAPNFVTDGESRFQTMYFGFGEPTVNDFKLESVYGGFFTMPTGENNPEKPIYVTKEGGEFDILINILCQLTISRSGNGFGDFDRVTGDVFFRINDEQPQRIAYFKETAGGGAFNYLISASYPLKRTLNIGDRIYLYARLHVFDIHEGIFGYRFQLDARYLPGSFMKMSAQSVTTPTEAKGVLIYEALDRLAFAMTEEPFVLRSTFFGRTDTHIPYPEDGFGSLLFLTGGFQLRGFPQEKKSLFASWQELIDSLNALYNIGVGVETLLDGQEVVVVENMEYFYSDEIVLDLTDPTESFPTLRLPGKGDNNTPVNKTTTATADFYNAVDIGYQKWRPNQVNGLEEFNTRHEYSLPLTQIKSKYTQLSSHITAGHYIETVRRDRYDETATVDTSSDDEGFLICVLRNDDILRPFVTERDQLVVGTVEGVFSPSTVYNLRLTPKRMLLRHAKSFGAGLIRRERKVVIFTFGEGNYELKSQLQGEKIMLRENSDARVDPEGLAYSTDYQEPGLAEPLWTPHQYSFEHPVKPEHIVRILNNPRGRIRFRDQKGMVREGWIIDLKHQLYQNLATFTLRAARSLVGGN